MGRLRLAWRVLTNGQFADEVKKLASHSPVDSAPAEPVVSAKPEPDAGATRSEAVTLLATLQREARLIDFVQEPIDGYSDAQVGAAVREVHRECAKTLDRLFSIAPLRSENEGSEVTIGNEVKAGRIRLSGNVTNDTPESGQLVHHGWRANKCELPEWTGNADAALVIAPAEVELS